MNMNMNMNININILITFIAIILIAILVLKIIIPTTTLLDKMQKVLPLNIRETFELFINEPIIKTYSDIPKNMYDLVLLFIEPLDIENINKICAENNINMTVKSYCDSFKDDAPNIAINSLYNLVLKRLWFYYLTLSINDYVSIILLSVVLYNLEMNHNIKEINITIPNLTYSKIYINKDYKTSNNILFYLETNLNIEKPLLLSNKMLESKDCYTDKLCYQSSDKDIHIKKRNLLIPYKKDLKTLAELDVVLEIIDRYFKTQTQTLTKESEELYYNLINKISNQGNIIINKIKDELKNIKIKDQNNNDIYIADLFILMPIIPIP
jgi:hypothetical protein